MIYCKRFDDHGQRFEGGVSAVDELSVENGRRHNQADQFVQDQRKELDHRLRFGVGQLADAVPGIFLKIFNNSVTNFVDRVPHLETGLHVGLADVRNDPIFFQCGADVEESIQEAIQRVDRRVGLDVQIEDAFVVVHPAGSGQHHFRTDVQVVGRRRIQHDRKRKFTRLKASVLHHRQPLKVFV